MGKRSNRTLVRGSRRYFVYFFISIVLIILTSLGTFEVIKRTDLLKLERIIFNGESDQLNFHIEQDLSKYFGINLYKLDLESIKDTLKIDYPIIADLSVNRRIFNKLKVSYGLESPFAIMNFADGRNYYVSRDLKLLERVNYGYLQKSLPMLTVKLKSKDSSIGTVIQDSTTHVMADYLANILEIRPDFQDKISNLFIKNDKVFFREISRGNVIYLGDDNISKKIDLFMSHYNSFSSGLYIDLSYKNQIVTSKESF